MLNILIEVSHLGTLIQTLQLMAIKQTAKSCEIWYFSTELILCRVLLLSSFYIMDSSKEFRMKNIQSLIK